MFFFQSAVHATPLATSTPKPSKAKGRLRATWKGKQPLDYVRQDPNSDDDFVTVDPAMFDDDDDVTLDSFTKVLFFKHLRRAGVSDELLNNDA